MEEDMLLLLLATDEEKRKKEECEGEPNHKKRSTANIIV